MKTHRIIFSGKVQGVCFRYYSKKKAIRLGLFGTVKNLEDGTVEMNVQGKEDLINQLVEYCKSSQPYAKVNDVDFQLIDLKAFNEFEIK